MSLIDEMKQTFLKVLKGQTDHTKIIIDRLRNRDSEVVNYDDYYFVSEDDYNMEKETYLKDTTTDMKTVLKVDSTGQLFCFLVIPLAIVLLGILGYLLYRVIRKRRNCMQIPLKKIEFHEKLASGNFGTVHRGLWKGRTEVAIKKLDKADMKSINDFEQEASIMKTMRHKNILSLLGICQTKEELYIITEYMKNGSLLNYLRKVGETLNKADLYEFAEQIACGMVYMEEQKYIHRDLAARNVLVDNLFRAKICDFGLTRAIQDEIYESRSRVCAVKWTAPEALQFQKYSHKSDIWSYGIVLHEIFSLGKIPYPGTNGLEILDHLRNGYRMSKPDLASAETYELMMKCWDWDEDKRPEFKQIHEFIMNICVNENMLNGIYINEDSFALYINA
ncbi:tyrosine-protein kinase SRK3-like [Ctenocephalides felis]|uniref:tyrosine-protein kinase SRK3-like n=1 Tax=Ctenocephalides felis TaxID=7515 RepID=UPI000E6E2604|nr:tyrosine-protein kinase SRK3-like [Ctenocephalides felis]